MGFKSSKRRKHSKVGETTVRAYHFRLDTTREEGSRLQRALDLGCELRNRLAALQEANRVEARAAKQRGEEPCYLSGLDLKKQVASAKLEPKFRELHSQVRQALSLRISEGQQRWFEALKAGRTNVRPPGQLRRNKFRSLTYPQYGAAANISHGKLHLSKLGDFKVKGWRKMRGAKQSITIKFKEGYWWAIVLCAVQEADVCRPYHTVRGLPDTGADPGLLAVLTDSAGVSYPTPKPLKQAAGKVRHISRSVSRKFQARKANQAKVVAAARTAGDSAPVASGAVPPLSEVPYSNRLKREIRKLARAHTKVARIREDSARKTARHIEQTYARVAVEEHGLVFMQRNRRTAKSASDVAIGKQKHAMQSALGRGRYFPAANRRAEGGNSQTCLCGASVPKLLSERWHACPACGLQGPRDQLSAIICQYETFGTLPNGPDSSPGLGELERAVRLLEAGRGEGKGAGGESRPAGQATAAESSVKRLAPGKRLGPNTTGAGHTASVGAETADHAGAARAWSAEAKHRALTKPQPAQMEEEVFRCEPGSPLLQVGE